MISDTAWILQIARPALYANIAKHLLDPAPSAAVRVELIYSSSSWQRSENIYTTKCHNDFFVFVCFGPLAAIMDTQRTSTWYGD